MVPRNSSSHRPCTMSGNSCPARARPRWTDAFRHCRILFPKILGFLRDFSRSRVPFSTGRLWREGSRPGPRFEFENDAWLTLSFLKTFSSLFDFGCKPLKIAEFFRSSREHIKVGLSVRPTEIKNARVSFRLPSWGNYAMQTERFNSRFA